jgi:hypothetical protein
MWRPETINHKHVGLKKKERERESKTSSFLIQLHRSRATSAFPYRSPLIMLFPNASLLVFSVFVALGLSASLVQVTDFGGNPSKINMYIYVPDKLAAKPAIIVAVS